MRRYIRFIMLAGCLAAGSVAATAPAAQAAEADTVSRVERFFLDLRVAIWPDDPNVRLARANLLYDMDLIDAALADYDRAIEIQPSVAAHMRRARARANHGDDQYRAAAYEDIQAALDEMPSLMMAVDMRATMRIQDAQYDEGIAEIDALLANDGGSTTRLLELRSDLLQAAGRPLEQRQLLADAVAKVPHPPLLNRLCWDRATAGEELEQALGNCDAALAQWPEFPDALDSRGVVLLRMGRVEEAIIDFNRALDIRPDAPPTLYVRGLARLRLARKDPSEAALAAADLQAARDINPEIDEEYASYGLTPEWASSP